MRPWPHILGLLCIRAALADVPAVVNADGPWLADAELLAVAELCGVHAGFGWLYWGGPAIAVPLSGEEPSGGVETALEARLYAVWRWPNTGPFGSLYEGCALMTARNSYRGVLRDRTLSFCLTFGVKTGWKIPLARTDSTGRRIGPAIEPYVSVAKTIFAPDGPVDWPVATVGLRIVWEWVRPRRVYQAEDGVPVLEVRAGDGQALLPDTTPYSAAPSRPAVHRPMR